MISPALLEALLFLSGKPYTFTQLSSLLEQDRAAIDVALQEVAAHVADPRSGLTLFVSDTEVALLTRPSLAEDVQRLAHKEVAGELTRPSVETLAIVAYRGPITKPELEQVRGVNCTLILRNLEMRGLVDAQTDAQGDRRYTVSLEYLRVLGVAQTDLLPDYAALHAHEAFEQLTRSTP